MRNPERSTKRCSRCQQSQPLAAFGKNRASKDGLNGACKNCLNAVQTERRRALGVAEQKRGPAVGATEKWCPGCDRILPRGEFHRSPARSGGINSLCKECSRAAVAKSYRKKRDDQGKPPRRGTLPGQKWCPDCAEFRPVEVFYRNKASADGLAAYCREHQRARVDASRARNGGNRNYHLKRRYGITEAEFDEMFVDQAGLCAACGEKKAEHVDHDHDSGKVRGLLCFTCNVALGNVGDDMGILLDLVDYLEEFGCEPQLTHLQRSMLRSIRAALPLSPSGSDPHPPTSSPEPGEDQQAS
ncbi:MAG: hypothetical protein QOE64_763 [Frankiales bacterium]|nr:hypothetical protein [Frankiales bacterium]